MYPTAIRWKRVGAAWLATLLVMVSIAAPASAARINSEQAGKALDWVKTQQQANGSFAGFGAGSTVDVLLAITAAGQDPSTYVNGGNTPVTFLKSKAADLAKTPGGAGKLLLAVSGLARRGVQFAATQSLIDAINASYDANTGQYGKDAIGHAFAMLGLASVRSVPPKAAATLKGMQAADGGWAFSGDTKAGTSDTNTTAVAVQALLAVGELDPATMRKAQAYLASQQNDDGGFPYQKNGEFGGESDVNSTSYVAQALIAMHADAERPVAYLRGMQLPSGAFQWKKSEPGENAGATYQAIPALLGVTLVPALPGAPVPIQNTGGISGGGNTPGVQPGMPRTGSSDAQEGLAAVAALAVLALGAGALARRKGVTL